MIEEEERTSSMVEEERISVLERSIK